MQTLIYFLSGACGLLAAWIVFLYAIVMPNKERKMNKAIIHQQSQAHYYHELANKANELNSNLKKTIDEYIAIEQKKSIDEFNKRTKGGPNGK